MYKDLYIFKKCVFVVIFIKFVKTLTIFKNFSHIESKLMCLSISVSVSPIEGKLIRFLLRFYSFLIKIGRNKVVCFGHFYGHFRNIYPLCNFFLINFFYVLYFIESKPMRLLSKSYILIQWVNIDSDKIVYFCGIFCINSSNVCPFSSFFLFITQWM